MVFKTRSICHPDNFRPFIYLTSPLLKRKARCLTRPSWVFGTSVLKQKYSGDPNTGHTKSRLFEGRFAICNPDILVWLLNGSHFALNLLKTGLCCLKLKCCLKTGQFGNQPYVNHLKSRHMSSFQIPHS